MKSATLVKFYNGTLDAFDVYDNKTGQFLYTTTTDPDIRVKAFSVYESVDGKIVLELYV